MLKELLTMRNHVEQGAYYLPKSGGYAHIGDLASESEAADAEHEDRARAEKLHEKLSLMRLLLLPIFSFGWFDLRPL